MKQVAESPNGRNAKQRREEAAPYKLELAKKEGVRDKLIVIAWALVIVGSACSLVSAIIA